MHCCIKAKAYPSVIERSLHTIIVEMADVVEEYSADEKKGNKRQAIV
jgi:hypothetical protein